MSVACKGSMRALQALVVWGMIATALCSPAVEDPDARLPDLSAEASEVPEFDTVKNFMLDTDGMKETVNTLADCQDKCTKRPECRSFSFSSTGNDENPGMTCIWTSKFIGFDPKWEFFTRTMVVDWTGKLRMHGNFKGFQGMRFVEDRFHETIFNVQQDDCRAACNDDQKCKAFSYRRDTQECMLSDGGLRYAPGFTYYERNRKVPGKDEYEHYPVSQTADEKAIANRVKRSQKVLALADRKARLKAEADKKKAEFAEKYRQAKLEHSAKEAKSKKEMTAENVQKEKEREESLPAAEKAARLRGEYAEMVQKSKAKVDQAKKSVMKETSAKNGLNEAKINEKTNEVKRQNREESQENAMKKQRSKINFDEKATAEKAAQLRHEGEMRIIQAEAFKLGAKERESKRQANLPGHVIDLIKTENKLRNQAIKEREDIKIADGELKNVKEQIARSNQNTQTLESIEKKTHQQVMDVTKDSQRVQLAEAAKLSGDSLPAKYARLQGVAAKERDEYNAANPQPQV